MKVLVGALHSCCLVSVHVFDISDKLQAQMRGWAPGARNHTWTLTDPTVRWLIYEDGRLDGQPAPELVFLGCNCDWSRVIIIESIP